MKKYLLFPILAPVLLLLAMLCPTISRADHIAGGELTYRCLGNDQYEIRLVLYRDMAGIQFDPPIEVDVYDAAANPISTATMTLKSVIVVDQPELSVCSAAFINLEIEKQVFLDTINLPVIAGGYILAYRDCCRSQNIINIQQALDTGAGFVLEITEASLNLCNASPTFSNLPPTFFCAGQPINHTQTVIDAEGDQIVYSLCAPLTNEVSTLFSPPFSPVNFVTPTYSATNMLGGANPLAINSSTGQMSGTPSFLGQFTYAVCVQEYRNGVLLSTIRLDFQMQVKACFNPTAGIEFPIPECNELNAFFKSQDTLAENWSWSFINAAGTVVGTSNLESFVYTFPDYGTYTVQLIVNAGSNCPDTATASITLLYSPPPPPPVLLNYECGTNGYGLQTVQYPAALDNDPNVPFWTLATVAPGGIVNFNNISPSQQPISIFKDGIYNFYFVAQYANGCIVYSDTVSSQAYNVIQSFPVDTVMQCGQDTVGLFSSNVFEADNIYTWTPTTGLLNPTDGNPLLLPALVTLPETYYLTITNSAGCEYIDSVTVLEAPMEDFEMLPPYCEGPHIRQPISLPLDLLNGEFVQNWDFIVFHPQVGPDNIIESIEFIADTTLTIFKDGWHYMVFTVYMKYGCVYEFVDSAFYNPIMFIPQPEPVACPTIPVYLNPFPGNETDNVYQWENDLSLDDGTAPNPSIINADSIFNLYSVTVTNSAGCVYEGTVQLVDDDLNFQASIDVFGLQCTYPILLVATHPTGVDEVYWSLSPDFGTTLPASDSTFEVTADLTGLLYYQVKPNEGCIVVDSIDPGLITDPVLTLEYQNGGCYNDSSIIVQAIPQAIGDFTINWVSPSTVTVIDSVTADFSYEGVPINLTCYLNTSSGCVTQLTQILDQIPPVIPDLTLLSNAAFCSNEPIVVAWPAISDTLSAVWGPATAINVVSDSLVNVTVPASPIWVTIQATTPSGCVYNDSILVSAPQNAPTLSLSFDPPTCAIDTAVLVTANTDVSESYFITWAPGEGLNPIGNNSTWVILQDTFINLTATLSTLSGCVISEDILLPAFEDYYLSATASATPDTIYLSQSATLNVETTGSGQPTNILWSPAASLDDPTVLQPIATPTETTVYTVAISNEDGCEAVATVALVVTAFNGPCDTPYIFLPNAFSPNSDGYNDTWRLYGAQSLTDCRIEVYSRLGELLYVSNSLDFEWDGSAKGRVLPPDAYAYILRYTCLSGEEFFRKGNVSLLR